MGFVVKQGIMTSEKKKIQHYSCLEVEKQHETMVQK